MAVDTQEVKYIFTGDTSSLSDATQQAIGLLDQYGNEIKKIVQQTSEVSKGAKEMSKATTSMNTLTSAAKKAAAAMKGLGVNVDLSNAKKQIATFATTVGLQIGILKYQFDPIIQKIQSMKSTVSSSFPRISKLASTVSSAFRRVAKSADEDTDSLNKNNIASKALKSTKAGLATASRKLGDYFRQLTTTSRETTKSFGSLLTTGIGLRSIFQTLTGYQLGTMFASGIKEALHYVEVLNMFKVVLGDSIDLGKDFVDTLQEMYGLDPTNIMEMTSQFYNLASAVETPAKAAEQMSIGLTKVAVDLSSLFDVDIETVASNLTSGMQGMTRAVRKYGIDLRMTTLEATALSYGLKLDASSTSEANRQALRYLTIIKQASRATGDFAKTIESPANQLRVLKEQFSQLARAIGNFFLPVLQKVLPYLNGIIMAIRTILQFFAQLLGIRDISFGGITDAAKEMDNLTSSASGLGGEIDNADKKAKKLAKDLLAPFDELNILKEDTSAATSAATGGGIGSDLLDPTLAKALEEVQYELDKVRMKANDVRDAILSFLGLSWDKEGNLTFNASQLEENLINKFPSWTQTIQAFFDNWDGIAAGVQAVWKALGTSIKSVFTGIVQGFTNMIQAMNLDELVAGWIEQLPDRLQAIADWLNNNQGLFVSIGEIIAYVGTAFATWKIVSKLLSPLVALATTIASLNPVVLTLIGAISAIAVGFVSAYNSSDRFKGMIGELKDSFGDMVGAIVGLMQSLWAVVEPVLSDIGTAIKTLWDNYVAPIVVNLATIVTEVITLISKILTFLLKTFGPQLSSALSTIIGIVQGVIQTILGIIDGLLTAIKGILQFLNGVFSGDWKKIWTGIKNIFKGVLNTMITLFEGMVNLVISLTNSLISLILGGISSLINAVAGAIQKVVDLLEIDWTVPTIGSVPKIAPVSVPRLAQGAVVSDPTLAMIGEGHYPEAVVPLGDSPQMQELIDKIAEAVDSRPDDDVPINVNMYLDGEVIYKSNQKVSRRRGVDFKMGAFER